MHHALLQRRNRPQRLAALGQLPVLAKFLDVELIPVQSVSQRAPEKLPLDHSGVERHRDLIISVSRMKVRRLVIAVVHGDHDPEEAAEYRHGIILAPWGHCCLPRFSGTPADPSNLGMAR